MGGLAVSCTMEYKSIQLKLDDIHRDGEYLYIEAYASVFGNVDSYRDIVDKGAFARTINGDNRPRIKFCYQHDLKDVRGKIMDIQEDEYGLKCTIRTSRTQKGQELAIQIEDGELFELSIGYNTKESDVIDGIRHIKEVELIEVSIVSRAANPKAVITDSERKEEFISGIKNMNDEELIRVRDEANNEYYNRIINHLNNYNL